MGQVCLLGIAILISGILGFAPVARASTDTDGILRKIIAAYGLRPLPTKPFEQTDKYLLGQALFFDPILSGNRDVSCATCHLSRRGTSDSLALSIGVGGSGLAENRRLNEGLVEHPRNSLDLWNRDNNVVRRLFWDGRVEVLDPAERTFRSPLGEHLPPGMENVLAVQALFPLARPDEMLGQPGERTADNLPQPHAGQRNEIAETAVGREGPLLITAVHEALLERVLGLRRRDPADWQEEYRRLFRRAYPGKQLAEMTIAEIGNAIAHFEEIAFATRDTPWDAYLSGDANALSASAKAGAIIFFGKGRCAVCHSGPLFSDFDFHSLAVPHAGPGVDMSGEDLGRYHVTGDPSDKYKFRTPPLRNVTLTAPYLHNGIAETLEEAIGQHVNPLADADRYDETGDHLFSVGQADSLSPVLQGGIQINEAEVELLIEFLKSLEDNPPGRAALIVPARVPSGLPVPRCVEQVDPLTMGVELKIDARHLRG